MTPPDGIFVCLMPAGGLAHSRQAATSSRCRSADSQPGTCTAPGAITALGLPNSTLTASR